MLKTKKISKKVDDIVDIICDSCQKSCNRDPKFDQCWEYATLKANWGYWSNKDEQHHEIHICERCYDFIITLMKIKPEIKYCR